MTKQEIIAVHEAIAHEIDAHRTGEAISRKSRNEAMTTFHSEKIALLMSAEEKMAEQMTGASRGKD